MQSTNEYLSSISRLVLAVLVGGLVGWNRQLNGKPAGLRTHMLVSLGAAVFVMIPWQISSSHSPDAISRAIQGVATGVGFLGAGEIIIQRQQESAKTQVIGLTSAAAIWITAALGMAAGCGLWQISLTFFEFKIHAFTHSKIIQFNFELINSGYRPPLNFIQWSSITQG